MGFELSPPRLNWVSLTAGLKTHTSRASKMYFISIMICSFIFQWFAIFNTTQTKSENACSTANLSKSFMQI